MGPFYSRLHYIKLRVDLNEISREFIEQLLSTNIIDPSTNCTNNFQFFLFQVIANLFLGCYLIHNGPQGYWGPSQYKIHAFSFKKMQLKMSFAKWCLFRLGGKVLMLLTYVREM